MSILEKLNAGQRKFAEAVAAGLSYTAAAKDAGYSARTAQPAGSRLAHDQRVQDAVAEIRAARNSPPSPPEPLTLPWIVNPGAGIPAPKGPASTDQPRNEAGEVIQFPWDGGLNPPAHTFTWALPPERPAPRQARHVHFDVFTGLAEQVLGWFR